jgi:competence protein ComEA
LRATVVEAKEAERCKVEAFAYLSALVLSILLGFALITLSGAKDNGFEGIVLNGRINPNSAPEVSLVRLPGIGDSKAKAIVAYRSDFVTENGQRLAFVNCNDLQNVKGIGSKTVSSISRWLKFE